MQTFALTLLALFAAQGAAAPPDFDRDVAPILAARCLDCHTGADAKGGVDLTHKAGTVGPVGAEKPVVPGKLDASLLWKKVAADEMPPKKPLGAKEKAILKEWIDAGAKWGSDPIDPFAVTSGSRAGRD